MGPEENRHLNMQKNKSVFPLAVALILTVAGAMTGCHQPIPPPPKFDILEPYAIRARVLSRTTYNNHWAPVDLALAWGELLPPATTEGIMVDQGDRKYWYFPPLGHPSQGKMAGMSANTHLITDDEEIRKEMLGIKKGDIIYLEGALVRATFDSGLTMTSSLSRSDQGDGACEVMWIKRLEKIENP